MKLSDLDQKIKLIVEAGFPFAKKEDEKEDDQNEKDTDKKENPFAKKEDGAESEDKESDKGSDDDDDDDDEKSESQPESKPASAPSDVMPKAETPKDTELKKTDAQPIASVNTELTGKEQQYLQPNPPLAPNAVKGEQPAQAVEQLAGNQSALAKELGNFVETAKALKGVLDVLKDFAQPTVVTAPTPVPASVAQPIQNGAVQPSVAQPIDQTNQVPSEPKTDIVPEKDAKMKDQDIAVKDEQNSEDPFGAEDQVDQNVDQETESGAEPVTDETGQDVQKGLTDEIKAAFKIKPGTKKYDPSTHQVYWKVGDVLMVAPADNPEDESEVTDENTINSVSL